MLLFLVGVTLIAQINSSLTVNCPQLLSAALVRTVLSPYLQESISWHYHQPNPSCDLLLGITTNSQIPFISEDKYNDAFLSLTDIDSHIDCDIYHGLRTQKTVL